MIALVYKTADISLKPWGHCPAFFKRYENHYCVKITLCQATDTLNLDTNALKKQPHKRHVCVPIKHIIVLIQQSWLVSSIKFDVDGCKQGRKYNYCV